MSDKTFQLPACECCGGNTKLLRIRKRGFGFYQCMHCETAFVYPSPTTSILQKLYSMENNYLAVSQDESAHEISPEGAFIHQLLIKYQIAPGRLLDVGCSTGSTLQSLCLLGWKGVGCEINEAAVVMARKKGLEVIRADLKNLSIPKASLDVVHMGNVLEHLQEPATVIRKAHQLLNINGLLILRIPNARSGLALLSLWVSKITRLPWVHSEAPYHLVEYTPMGIRLLLERNNFRVLELNVSGRPGLFYFVGAFGWFDQLKKRIKVNGRYRLNSEVIRYIPKLAVASLIVLVIVIGANIADRFRKSGQIMTVLARAL